MLKIPCPYFLSSLLALFIISCHSKPEQASVQLDYYLNPQSTQIDFSFPEPPDSINLSLSFWQQIEPSEKFDTLIVGNNHCSKSILIEKPLLVEVFVNGQRDELFVLPGKEYQVELHVSDTSLRTNFTEPTMAAINNYFDQKSAIINHKDLRLQSGSLLTVPLILNIC